MRQDFENVREQIGACGLWCGSCAVGNGTPRELGKRYADLVAAFHLDDWGLQDYDYTEFAKGLNSIQGVAVCPGCLHGGGRDDCELRSCGASKSITTCHDCPAPPACEHAELLQRMRDGAAGAGMYVDDGKAPRAEQMERWMREAQRRWPMCIIFAECD